MNIKEKINSLRQWMCSKNIDAYIIPSFDAHQSEYVAEHWKSRTFISGFTGSAGTVVVTKDKAGLWTDGRYFIQAEKQLEGSGIKLFKMMQPNVPTYVDWIYALLNPGGTVGFDGKVFPTSTVKSMEKKYARKNIRINAEYDLIDFIWDDRPASPLDTIFTHPIKYAGKSRTEKIDQVRAHMQKKDVTHYLLGSLDDIAWLFNIRGNDIHCSPVAISYALISQNEANLFIDHRKVPKDIRQELEDADIIIKEYNEIENCLKNLKNTDRVLLDPDKINIWLYHAIPNACEKIEQLNITTSLKAVKNPIEIENIKNCHIRDGVYMVKLLHWLDQNLGKEKITEITVDEKLTAIKAQDDQFVGLSFDTIAGYKDHAAMMHYKATPEITYELEKEGFLLLDAGSQYFDGTTDITRTIALGTLSEEEKIDFTLVLKGHIALTISNFLYGSTGERMDILARMPLWEHGIDYKCGTGHGVGFFLNVHEGPHSISPRVNTTILEKGMIVTNEPGVYKQGKHGIRTENILLITEDSKTDSGQFMKFETISFCPIDLEGIIPEMLIEKERDWLNTYHKNVYEKLSPYLNEEEKAWLKQETRAI
ncbi:aminopeptidase P family protein [Marinisporobacter balticus]|uniref:Xaa-Pro aminopeptidase n=1 Tax=Marinisporobacter balticus TaxID=2018667 RepID=A0A4R2KY64_9FIRM|nr:aminopeptidase P family protein [Marinisporobacter balticus]TCO75218.1 Xaa-Pro aminopeptidase [Marinisporobacter balticus]